MTTRPPWMSEEEWLTYMREFDISRPDPEAIPATLVSLEDAQDLRRMVNDVQAKP